MSIGTLVERGRTDVRDPGGASHEIVESASDPVQTQNALGYYLDTTDTTVLGWNALSGGEIADLRFIP